MLKHQMQKRYTELSSRFEGGKRERGNIGNETNLVQAHANCERERAGCKLAAIGPLPIANGPLPVNK